MISVSGNRMLVTWLDIERVFKRATHNFGSFPKGVSAVRCYADGVEIEAHTTLIVNDWLKDLFQQHYDAEKLLIAFSIDSATYSVDVVISIEEAKPAIQYPLWNEFSYGGNIAGEEYPEDFQNSPHMVSFHSFKGGVGRTTALTTYAAAYLAAAKTQTVRILLVDGDLEAPGISLWLDEKNKASVSFIQFLEAVHYPPISVESTLDYFASELRKTSFNVDGVRKEVFVLPSALSLTEVMDIPVQPSHIAKNPQNRWLLTEHLHELGRKLDVDMVFIDLRAGLSELSSPILFDPRVEHFFVTTVAPQSVIGTAAVLQQISNSQASATSEDRLRNRQSKPSVILSLLTAGLRKQPEYAQSIEMLTAAYQSGRADLEEEDGIAIDVSPIIDWSEAEFEPSLMSIGSLRQAFEVLTRSPLYEGAKSWANEHPLYLDKAIANNVLAGLDIASHKASDLFQVCEKFQFAESSVSEDMLITDPLRNLAKHYFSEVPNAVSVGAKGAGKTFTYLQLCRARTWENFLIRVGGASAVEGGAIFPVLSSTNVDGESLKVVRDALAEFNTSVGVSGKDNVLREIRACLADPSTNWDIAWEKMLCQKIFDDCHSFESLNSMLLSKNKTVVFIIDGIEDAFDDPAVTEQRVAIKALLELPNRINLLMNRRVGLICFVREDYVQLAIRQNLSQFLTRFIAFKLEWTPEAFLRLVYWVCSKANVINSESGSAETLLMTELLSSLESLWGRKMGKDDSKEANTARWVFAALCDLNGRLQARDIVRFLKFAAKLMQGRKPDVWPTRVLHPEAIRKSLSDCSMEKVREATTEVTALKIWQDRLISISPEFKKVPFNPVSVGLTDELVRSLKEIGVIYEDVERSEELDRFYLPEIYRTGLGFKSAISGRPRVQALLKRNLGGMPF